jgi:uracil phosphoribosyltransferase
MNYSNLTLVAHPLIDHSLTIIRDQETKQDRFRRHATIVSKLLILEATKNLTTKTKIVHTPLDTYQGKELEESIVLVPVLRAGLSMLFAAQELLPTAPVGFVGLARDEETAIAKAYYQKLPALLTHSQVFILDPMLATGGSLYDTISEVTKQGATDIRAVCVVAAPAGVAFLEKEFPHVHIYTAAVDSHLNDKKYIVPGLGDFGDRYFGT